ncbi:DUF2993 domain-containing protein [Aldersonia sp. NBC_00410]|jgi:LmeA-like phospholipid-binding|uniref:LmeA family phospholipid-binding protein n=1 Tax=Aldersonia sp. NBC_00410 TaxID=2975954 RepID=UPI00225BAA30|nr:DUF2993 domain-containing protein [Aldersonia sp. NBC_00410]MCX5041815.1 DUF2993 domain-containing protein [Aldersonia sp. NBC_00410]
MVTQMNAPAPAPKSRRNRVLAIVIVVVVLLAAGLVGAELYARHTVVNCLTEQFEADLGSQVDIGLSAKPVLLQAIDKQVPHVTIDSADSSFGPAQDMQVHARANDIDITGTDTSAASIGNSSADIAWSADGILRTVQAQTFGGLISSVQSSAADGTLTFDVGPAGLAQLVVRPVVGNGMVDVETVSAEVLGLGIPTDLVDGVVQIISTSLQNYPLGMTPQSLVVDDTGITMSLAGGAYDVPQATDDSARCGV